MAITDTLNLNAQQVAEQNPELHQMRQKFFGQDYLSDIQKGDTGTVQYYKGLGDPNAINYTGEQTTQPIVDTSTPVVDTPVVDTGGGGGGGQNVVTGGDGIMSTAPAMNQAAAIEAMTQPEAYDIPGTMPQTPVSGAFGPFDYLQPTTPITQDPMTGDASIAEAIAAQDRQDVFDEQFAFEDPKALAARGMGPVDPYGFEDQRALAARQGVVEPTDPFAFEDARTQQLRGVEPEQILPVAKPEVFDYSTALGDDWALGDEFQPTTPAVTGIEGPPSIISDPFTPTGPNMADVAGPVQNITLPSGDVYAANDPQLLEKVDPETKENTNMIAGLWDKAAGNIDTFKNSLTATGKFGMNQILSLGNAFANPSAMSFAGAAGIPGMIISILAGSGTQVSPEQKAANAAFEQANNITIGDDGRITSGVFAGKNPAGKSFAGSATYEEMLDDKINYFEDRIEKGKSYSEEKYQEALDLKAKTTTPTDETTPTITVPDFISGGVGKDDPTPTGPATVEGTAATEDIGFDEPSTFTPTTITPHTPTTTPFNPAQGGSGGDPSPPSPRGARDSSQGQTGMGSCFIAGTKVRMADGTDKNIEDVIVGDTVKGQKGNNKVVALDPTLLGDRKLYSFNDNEHYFFTSEHPFMTEEGWKSIKPEKTKERDGVELYDQLKGELEVGDKLITDSGVTNITKIKSKEMNDPKMPLYNFHISNDNSYIADDYVVHNKGGGCFVKGTPITMADGSTKPVEQVDLGDKIAEGGKVFAAGRFLTEELYDYEGIKVSGSHMVNEDDTWVRVRDSKKGKPLGDDEHTVYVFGAENRRILINGILFTDYFEVKEQDKLATIGNKYFDQWGIYAKNDDINNVNTLNAS